jgi:hypothetical protein
MKRIAGRKLPTIGLALILQTALAGAASSETLTYEHAGEPLLEIDLAAGWSADLDFDQEAAEAGVEPGIRVLELSPEDGSHAWMGLWVPPDIEDLEAAARYLGGLYEHILQDVEADEPASDELNGMAADWVTGTARLEGESVRFLVVYFQVTPKTAALSLWAATPETVEAHRAELEAMIRSIRPAAM